MKEREGVYLVVVGPAFEHPKAREQLPGRVNIVHHRLAIGHPSLVKQIPDAAREAATSDDAVFRICAMRDEDRDNT